MKVYFAGSIRAGRSDARLYHRLTGYIKKSHTVLTEHVGDLALQEDLTDREIYAQDTAWLREADIVIAECTCPSLGVGYELAYAEAHGVPCHILCDETKTHLSAMLTGNPNFHVYNYREENELYAILDEVLGQ